MASFLKQNRITNESQIKMLFDTGKSISSDGITLKYISNQLDLKLVFCPKRLHNSCY